MLYIVATPIGNLKDISLRALDVLKSVDIILCEDTRVTKKLLCRYEIKKQCLSYHQHSDEKKVNQIIDLLKQNKDIALVSDAGTPSISDPGNELIAVIKKELPELKIVPIPGASSLITCACVSGFPMSNFLFLGFPPKKNKRNKFFKKIEESIYPVVIFESTHRIKKTLEELTTITNNRDIVVCRELTKKFEKIYLGTANNILKQLGDTRPKGEFVIIISKNKKNQNK